MKKLFLATVFILGLSASHVSAHCEIPCGIFADGTRFDLMMEDATTIEKSMNEINTLSGQENPDYHTISRWTMNKEDHANKIQHKVAQYFLAQRIKLPADDASVDVFNDYAKSLQLLHHITVRAMKTKHSANTEAVEALRSSIEAFKAHYYKDHDENNDHKH